MRFTPHVTVATIIEDNGRFLMVEELAEGRAVFNQPAGHLEADESLIQAALRETLEETGWMLNSPLSPAFTCTPHLATASPINVSALPPSPSATIRT